MVEPTETARQVKPIWKCEVENCPFTYPPTLKGYRQMKGHQLRHDNEGVPEEKRGYHLRDENTGEVLAQSIKEASPFLMVGTPTPTPPKKIKPTPTPPPPVLVSEVPKKVEAIPPTFQEPKKELPVTPPETKAKEEAGPPKEKPKAKGEKEGEITSPQTSSDGIFRYTISLPADAFTLFNLAKTFGLEKDSEKPFDEWLWDCIRMRYKTDYKMRLVLAPEEE